MVPACTRSAPSDASVPLFCTRSPVISRACPCTVPLLLSAVTLAVSWPFAATAPLFVTSPPRICAAPAAFSVPLFCMASPPISSVWPCNVPLLISVWLSAVSWPFAAIVARLSSSPARSCVSPADKVEPLLRSVSAAISSVWPSSEPLLSSVAPSVVKRPLAVIAPRFSCVLARSSASEVKVSAPSLCNVSPVKPRESA